MTAAVLEAPVSRRKLRARTPRSFVSRLTHRAQWKRAMRAEKTRVTYSDFLVAVGRRSKPLTEHEANKRKPAQRFGRSLRKGAGGRVGYQPAVRANEYIPRGEQKPKADSLVLTFAEQACNLQPFSVRHAAALMAATAGRDGKPGENHLHRASQRALRQRGAAARKARRGWR